MIVKLRNLGILAGLFFAVSIAQAEDKPATDKTVDASEIEARMAPSVDGEGQDASAEKSEAGKARPKDKAFAAFQLGEYLSALAFALPRAEQGDAAAQTLIAEIYDRGLGIKRDPEQAATWYAIAAKSGNREAQFAYSVKLMSGDNVEKDVEQGAEMLQLAADAGHALASFNYASYVISQRPTGAGYRQALPYLETAAENRVADAFYSLSQIYKKGLTDGIQRPEKARFWLIRAARAGVDTAQMELAFELLRGENGEKNEKQAYQWFRQAAIKGNVIAQNRLAYLYLNGIGVEESSIEAAKWHMLARRAGRQDKKLDRFVERLDEETRTAAIALVQRWPSGG